MLLSLSLKNVAHELQHVHRNDTQLISHGLERLNLLPTIPVRSGYVAAYPIQEAR